MKQIRIIATIVLLALECTVSVGQRIDGINHTKIPQKEKVKVLPKKNSSTVMPSNKTVEPSKQKVSNTVASNNKTGKKIANRRGGKTSRVSRSESISLTVSSNELSFSPSGGTKTIYVETNGTWYIGTDITSWGHLTKSGNQLSIKIDPNSGTSLRKDWFTINAGNRVERINISQSGSTSLSVSSENLSFDYLGGTQTINISTNGSWEVGLGTASWVHLRKMGNQLNVEIDKNSQKVMRTDWFTINAGNIEKRIRISQNGFVPSISVSNEKLSFSSYGGSQTITVNSNVDWNVSVGTESWGHLSKYGNSLSVRIDKNKKKTARTDFFKLKADDKEVKVNITQEGRYRRPFNQAVDNYAGGFSVGYFQKQWVYNINGDKTKMGVFDDDKYLQGIQAGLRVDPQFGVGFGMNSGIFYEFCWAKSNVLYDDYGSYNLKYKEHGLYMPIHFKYTMNFSKWFQLSFYGGAGLNYVISGKASVQSDGDSYDLNVFKEEADWKRFNTMLEYGASVRINAIQFDFTMSHGLTNWSESNDYELKVGRPLSVSATICF